VSADRPYETTATLTGNGVLYDLTLTAWEDRWSRVIRVEFPSGERIPVYLEARRYMVLPGTTTFRLLTDIPATGQSCVVTYGIRWPTPTDTSTVDKIPAGWFDAVASLAASEIVRAIAIDAARKQSSSVMGQRYEMDPEPLFSAAKNLRALYDEVILGKAEDPGDGDTGSASEIAYAIEDQETFPDSIFHRRVS
jgi:hypothetical protein